MKKLSYWSKRNPISARLLIALGHVIMGILGILYGIATYVDDILIPSRIIYILFIVFGVAYVFYPLRGKTVSLLKYSWSRRVKHDFILVLSYSCILTVGVNQFAFKPITTQKPQLHVRLMVVGNGGVKSPITKKEIKNGIAQSIKAYKTEIKTQLKSLKSEWKQRKENKGDLIAIKVVLILLALGLALVVASGIGNLACSLSCSGQEGLAWIVLIVGTASLVLLTLVGIRAILKIGKDPEPKPKIDEHILVKK